jgi:Ca-activated chloride channel homolog
VVVAAFVAVGGVVGAAGVGMRVKVLLSLLLAVSATDAAQAGTWTDMWSTREQQAQKLLDSRHPDQAAPLFGDARRRGYAQMEAGQFDKAAKSLAPFKDADSQYNRGNALAHTGQLREALSAYDAALAASPGNKDVIRNRDLVKQALDQQQAQSGQQGGSKGQPGSQGSKGGQSQGGNHSAGGNQPQPGDQSQSARGGQGDQSQATNQGQRDGQSRGNQSHGDQSQGNQPGQSQQGSQSQASNPGQRDGQSQGNPSQDSGSQANSQGQRNGQSQGSQAQSGQSPGGQQAGGASPGGSQSTPGNQAGGQAQGQQSQANTSRSGNNTSGEGALAPNGQKTNGQTGAAGLNAENAQQDANAALRYRQSQQGRSAPGANPSGPNSQASVLGGDGKAPASSAEVPPPKPPSEQAMALDQWLRGIPDDSAELLRRKFLIEHMLKQQQRDQL